MLSSDTSSFPSQATTGMTSILAMTARNDDEVGPVNSHDVRGGEWAMCDY
jgi:hypothetical protein